MKELLLLAPLRLEALAVRSSAATVIVTGYGRHRSEHSRTRLDASIADHRATAVVGFCGAVDPSLAPGDLVVASAVRGPSAVIRTFPGAAMLAGALRRAGLRAHVGPVQSLERLARESERAALHDAGAIAVDMESAWLVDGTDETGSAVVRAVVDTRAHGLLSPRTAWNSWLAARSLRAATPVLAHWAAAVRPRRVMVASPRGFCAGVERAIAVVERALERYGAPIYVRRHIIHNTHVVADLAARGAVFVEELDEVPTGSRVVFAAHGVAPHVREDAVDRGLLTIDATCPLVAKVHSEVRHFAARDYRVFLIGHPDHEEVQGTTGEAPESIVVIEDARSADDVVVADPHRVAYVTQTTLAVDEVVEIIDRLRARFPAIEGPAHDDICYATQNRQDAAREMAQECDVVLVVGSATSSNSKRLVEVVERDGRAAHLLDDDSQLDPAWVAGAETVGITAGASAPETMVQRVIATLGSLGPLVVAEHEQIVEDVRFATRGGEVMGIPARQTMKVGWYLFRNRVARRQRFALVVELEPLFACNLACPGCGKIQYPTEILRQRVSVEQAVGAVEECGAPVVSIAGGEPLLHPDIGTMVAELVARKRFVYLCTNAVLLRRKLDLFAPSPYFAFTVHIDGLHERHDDAVDRPGVFDEAVAAVREAKARGFRVTTNSTFFTNDSPETVRGVLDYLNDELEVDAMMISPAYAYEKAPDQEHFLGVEQTRQLFRATFADGRRRRWRLNHSPLFLDFLEGKVDYQCTAWGIPSYSVFGWQRPCYLMADGYTATYRELVETTDWERYGRGKDPRCANCMAHCGYEPTAVVATMSSLRESLRAMHVSA